MRSPWPHHFPPVLAHSAWESVAGESALPDHPSYWPAKKRRDARAALSVCRDLVREEVLEHLYDECMDTDDGLPPIVAVPATTPNESQNYLAIGYGQWLAHEMGWPVDKEIFQAKTVSRDFTTDGWFRFVHQPEFYGKVYPGRRYVLADDVCTMGGTLATLQGFIESKGGTVIAMSVLATRDGCHAPISLAESTFQGLTAACGGGLDAVCRAEIGYGLACLTDQEGRFLLRCPTLNAVRKGIDGTRNA
jgi:hypothetical protein